MKKQIFIAMAMLCLNFSQLYAQEMTNKIIYEGQKLFVHDEKNIYHKDGKNYVLMGEKTYEVHAKEGNHNGPVSYNIFIKVSEDSTYSLSKAYGDKLIAKRKKQGVKVIKAKSYPDSKPFVRYTSPKSGKKYKFYDVKRTKDGHIISEEEFQSYRGNYVYIRRINGGDFAMDTSIIEPPSYASIAAKKKEEENFKNQVGKNAPFLNIEDIHGNKFNTNSMKGKVVVINFWFVACPPCIKEIPDLNNLVQNYDENEVVFLGLSTDNQDLLGRFLSETAFNFNIVAEAKSIAKKFNVMAYPSHFVIDKEGKIAYVHTGLQQNTISEIKNAINKALAKNMY